jgi:hypothetical protein
MFKLYKLITILWLLQLDSCTAVNLYGCCYLFLFKTFQTVIAVQTVKAVLSVKALQAVKALQTVRDVQAVNALQAIKFFKVPKL